MEINLSFSQRLLIWYRQNARRLPWRGLTDPYAIWVSEIMAQQTRVETVTPYFTRWMERFPTVETLAAASEQEVLSMWEGLGYYGRARNLLKAAQIITVIFGGQLPRSLSQLERLPGVGRYTAAAICSIAFGQPEPVLDGNVKRVLSRVFDIDTPVNTPRGEKECWNLAGKLIPSEEPGDYNQAMMELGAMLCTPRSPACTLCPISDFCRAFSLGIQQERPVMLEKPTIPTYTVTAAILHRADRVLIARRPSKGLLGGLWEFPGGKVEEGETLQQALAREISEELGINILVLGKLGEYRHAYTHFRVQLTAFHASLDGNEPVALEASEIRWVKLSDLSSFPMGKIDRRISIDLERQNGFS